MNVSVPLLFLSAKISNFQCYIIHSKRKNSNPPQSFYHYLVAMAANQLALLHTM